MYLFYIFSEIKAINENSGINLLPPNFAMIFSLTELFLIRTDTGQWLNNLQAGYHVVDLNFSTFREPPLSSSEEIVKQFQSRDTHGFGSLVIISLNIRYLLNYLLPIIYPVTL